jgi:hypothetical protein
MEFFDFELTCINQSSVSSYMATWIQFWYSEADTLTRAMAKSR